MPYQRAFSTLGCAELDPTESIALAARHGLDGVELRAAGGTLDLPDYFARKHGLPAAFAKELRESGGRIFAIDSSLRLVGCTPRDRDDFLRFVPWAEESGVPWLRVFDGDIEPGGPGETGALETVRWWRETRRRNGWRVDIVVETHDSLLDADRISRFVSAAPGTRILWDTHHTWKQRGEDPVATWRAIAPHVAHIHVKDSISRPSDKFPYTYVPPGSGEFPMARLAAVLRSEFSGVVSLEWERMWHPYLPPLETALKAADQTSWW